MESHPNDGDGEIQKAVSEAYQDLDPELGWLMTFMWNLAEAELGKEPRDVSVGFLKYSGFTVLKDNTPHATKARHGSHTARLPQFSKHGPTECV